MACPAAGTSIVWLIEPACSRIVPQHHLAGLAVLLALIAQPLAAQTQTQAPPSAPVLPTDPALDQIIPDAALADPEGWATRQLVPVPVPVPAPSSAPAEAGPALDSAAPLADNPEMTLPWPDAGLDLPAFTGLEPDEDARQALVAQQDEPEAGPAKDEASRLSPQLAVVFPLSAALLPERESILARFRPLSAILTLAGGRDDSIAQLAVRARTDRELLLRLLRNAGYYDAEVYQTVNATDSLEGRPGPQPAVRFEIVPGARFRFGSITLGELAASGPDYAALRQSFALQPGDPLSGDAIIVQRGNLETALAEGGYSFARMGDPDLLVDHRREEGDLNLPVTPGGKYRFAGITSNLPAYLSGDHLLDIARFKSGDPYRRSQVEDLRRAILATSLVSSVAITPREIRAPAGGDPGTVQLDVTLAKAPQRTISGAVGYDSGDGLRLEASWEHRNLFPPEGLLRLRGIAGTREQLAGITLRRNNFRGRDQVLTFDLYADNANRTAYQARTLALTGSFEKLTTLIFQKPWVWSVGFEAIATAEREGAVGGALGARWTYFIGSLPLRAAFDSSDDLLDPSRGMRAALRVSPELSALSGARSGYARIQADASWYQPLGKGIVLAARGRIGSIVGTNITNIAPSRRFYAGGGGSIRGFGYQQIGPHDSLGDPSGGRSLSEFSAEVRVKTGLLGGALALVPFIDAGAVDESPGPRLRDIRYGAGLGFRYQTGFGPIRIDLGTPLNRRPGESVVAVYVALGQAF